MPEIITRDRWGARYRDGWGYRALPASHVFLHHTVTPSAGPEATFEADCATIRTVENVGYARFGGISYNFLITQAGRIFQGVSVNRIGAHTAGYNTSGIGISLVGNYDALGLTEPVLTALRGLLLHLRTSGALTSDSFLQGHFEVAQTACPGAHVRPYIDDIDNEATIPIEGADMAKLVTIREREGFVIPNRLFNPTTRDYMYRVGSAAVVPPVDGAGYTDDGPAFAVSTTDPANTEMIHSYTRQNGKHILAFPSDAQAGWVDDGGVFMCNRSGSGAPVYRFYDPANGTHFHTTNPVEGANLKSDGIAFYLGITPSAPAVDQQAAKALAAIRATVQRSVSVLAVINRDLSEISADLAQEATALSEAAK